MSRNICGKQIVEIPDLNAFKQGLCDGFVAVVVRNNERLFQYGEPINKHDGRHIDCRTTGARVLFPQADVSIIVK